MAKYENPAELDYRNGGDTVDDFAQKYMRTVDYIIKALNDLRTPTGNTAGVEPEPYMWRIADNKLYIRNADNTDYVLLGDISPNFGFRQSMNDRFITTADLEREGTVVVRDENNKVTGDITGSPNKIADKPVDVIPTSTNDILAYDATQQAWIKKTLNDYLKKTDDPDYDDLVAEIVDQVITDITPVIFNYWRPDAGGYLTPLGSNVIAPQYGSTNNSVGAVDRPWHEGHFDSVKLNGGDLGEYLAESTGFGIVSGCEPSISGLTVTVSAGVYHTKEGTRVNIAEKTITVNAADATNPRYDVIYLDSNYVIQYQAGTAAVNPAYPSLPSGAEELFMVTVNAGVTKLEDVYIQRVGVKYSSNGVMHLYVPTCEDGDCTVFVTPHQKVIMIDCLIYSPNLLIGFLKKHNINHIDFFFLTHYHGDHYGSLPALLDSNEIDTSSCQFYLPRSDSYQSSEIGGTGEIAIVQNYFTSRNLTFSLLNNDGNLQIEDNVKITWINCRDEDYDFYNSLTDSDLGWYHSFNLYSVQFFIEYGEQRVLIGGDGDYVVYSHLIRSGRDEIKKCSVMKVGHHGQTDYEGSPQGHSAGAFVRKVNPEILIVEGNRYGGKIGDNFYEAQHGLVEDFCKVNNIPIYANKMGEIHLCLTPFAINVIDGHKMAGGKSHGTSYISAFVDASNTNKICDGSEDNPFSTIQQAIACCSNKDGVAKISIAAGTYGPVSIYNNNLEFDIQEGTVTIDGEFSVNKSTIKIDGAGSLVVNDSFSADSSNIDIAKDLYLKTPSNPSNYIATVLTSIITFEHLHIDGSNSTIANWKGLFVSYASLIRANRIYVTNITNTAAFRNANGVLAINTVMECTNVAYIVGSFGDYTAIDEYATEPTFLNNEILWLGNGHLKAISTPYTRKQIGTTAERPTYKYTGQMYFDKTLKTLIVWYDNAWHKASDGATV